MDNLLRHEALDRAHIISTLIAESLLDHQYFHNDDKALEMATLLSDAAGALYQYLGSLDDDDNVPLKDMNEEQYENIAKLTRLVRSAGGSVIFTRKPNAPPVREQGILLLPDTRYGLAVKDLTEYLSLLKKPVFDRLVSL
jgi:hypothetical protein